MANSPTFGSAKDPLDPHLELALAHHEAARTAALLHEHLARAFQIDLATTRKQAIQIGSALERVVIAERACGSCGGQNHTLTQPYQEMLENHRLAFIDFNRLSQELGCDLPPGCSEVAALASDIERHLNAAEKAHQASIWPASEKKAR